MKREVVGFLVAMSLVVAACSGSNSEDLKAELEELRSQVSVLEAAATSSSIPAIVTTTTPEVASTIVETTTTVRALTEENYRVIFSMAFEPTRREYVSYLNNKLIVKSVDFLEYDPLTNLLTLDVTPTFDFDLGVRDDAWELTRDLSGLWNLEGDGVWLGPIWKIVISTATYQCSPETMRSLLDARLSRQQWEAQCRVR